MIQVVEYLSDNEIILTLMLILHTHYAHKCTLGDIALHLYMSYYINQL